MFLLFCNLYLAMFTGTWNNFPNSTWASFIKDGINGVGQFITSIFGDSTYNTLGDVLISAPNGQYVYQALLSFILALITSIGIVVMAVKGIKRVFGVFFMFVR